MATFKFLFHPSTRGDAYAGSIKIRLIHQRRVKVTTTGVKLYAREWDAERQEIILPQKESDRYAYLRQMRRRLENHRREFEQTMAQLDPSKSYTLSDIAESNPSRLKRRSLQGFIEDQAIKLTKLHQERAASAYRSAGRRLIAFNQDENMLVKDINFVLIKSFESHLQESGKTPNTISFYMRMLRAIYNRAIAEKVIKARRFDPFEGVFTGFEQDTNAAGGSDPLSRLHNLPFSGLLEQKKPVVATFQRRRFVLNPVDHTLHEKSLYDSWRYFLFCYHAGMSFMNMACLRKKNISRGMLSYYHKEQQQAIEIPLSPLLKQLIGSFSAEVKHIPYLFPIIAHEHKRPATLYYKALIEHKKGLKRLASMAGITGDLFTCLNPDNSPQSDSPADS